MTPVQELERENQVPFSGDDLFAIAASIVSHSRFYFPSEEDREDAIQQLCLVGLECLQKVEDGGNTRSYQYVSMRGALMNFCRRLKYRNVVEKKTLDIPADGESAEGEGILQRDLLAAPETEHPLFKSAVRNAVAAVLASLSERERVIVEKCLVGKYTLELAGLELGITRERVRQILEKAKETLRDRLAKYACVAGE
jgi:RNA polymerase sigma factor (sigma-70 family)